MRRRLDAGHLQLEAQRRLLHQKRALAATGEALLAQHCRASWQQAQHTEADVQVPSSSAGAGIELRSLQAECAAGQWWLRAVVACCHAQQPGGGGSSVASASSGLMLLAASTECSAVCSRQRCTLVQPSGDGQGSGSSTCAADGAPLLELTAVLEVHLHGQQGRQGGRLLGQGQGQPQAGDVWVDVFLLQERSLGVGSGAVAPAAAAPMAAPPAFPPVPLGRVHLRWPEWLRSHSRPPLPQPEELVHWRHHRAISAASEHLDLSCLHRILCEQLGCTPPTEAAAGHASNQAGGGQQAAVQRYVLPGPSAQHSGSTASEAAEVRITQHDIGFAEVELHAGSTQMLDVLEQQLGRGLAAAASQAGAPEGAVSLTSSLLSQQHVQQAGAAVDALVAELDASIEWMEALLKQKLALGCQQRRQRPDVPPDCWSAEVQHRQAGALAAMAATDACMVELLS